MRLLKNAILPLGLTLLAAAGVAAATQNAALTGRYTYVEAESDAIKPAIEQAVAKMNFITRPIARGRLTRTNEPYRSLSIQQSAGQVTIVRDAMAPIVAPADGNPIKWTREDGEVLDLTTRWVDETLEQTFIAEDGQRKNVFALSPDGGTLEMQVTVTSPRLAAPLTYTLRYRRQ